KTPYTFGLGGKHVSLQARLLTKVWTVAECINEAAGRAKRDPNGALVVGKDPKEYDSALRKLATPKINYDWRQLNDLSRCTLVVPRESEMADALQRVIAHFGGARDKKGQWFFERARHQSSFRLLAYKPILASGNLCGYSHEAISVQTADRQRAEVQINYPAM